MATTVVINGGASPQEVTAEDIGTVVNLTCPEGAGLWTFVDKPAGSAAVMTTLTSIDTNSFTPDKEGSYLVRCTRGGGGVGNVGDGLLVVTSDGFTDLREIAWKETLEHAARGWAVSLNNAIRWIKRTFNRPKYVLVKVDAAYGGYVGTQRVWRVVGAGTTGSGEAVPLVLPAASETAAVADTTKSTGLLWKPSAVAGLVAGDLFHALVEGYVDENFAAVFPVGSPVYLNGDDGQISTLAGLAPIIVGRTALQSGPNYKFYFKPEPTWFAGAFANKGDLLGGTATNAFAALGVGANGTVLKADSAETTGLKWDTLAQIIKDVLLTADGDVLIRAGGTVQRLAVGAAHTGLFVNSGATSPEWATLAQKIKDTVLTADGDLLYRAGGTVQRLAVGSASQILQVTGGVPVWTTFPGVLASAFTTAGDLLYGTGAGTTARLGIGTAGQILRVNGGATAPEWAALDDTTKIAKSLLTTIGDLVYASGVGTPARLGIGSAGHVLTVSGGVPAWAAVDDTTKVLKSLYTAKGDVLGASAANTPVAATGAIEGGLLRKTDESNSGVEWADSFGYPARLVSSSAGPFNLNDGDAFTLKCSADGTIETTVITVNAVDVIDINAVTPSEIVALVGIAAPSSWSARVRTDGKLEVYCSDTGMSPKLRNNPANYVRIAAISASMESEIGWSVDQFGWGSGATPGNVLSGSAAPYVFAGTETLTLEADGTAITSDVFQVGDTTAALVAARLNGTAAFVSGGLLAFADGTSVRIAHRDASRNRIFRVTGGTANGVLNFSTMPNDGDGGVFDLNLSDMQRLSKDLIAILLKNHVIASLGTTSGAIAIDMTAGGVQNLTIDNTSSFSAANIDSTGFGYTISVFITASGADRTVSFDTDWKWIGSKPATIASGVTGCLTLTNRGSADTDIVASYSVLGTG